MDDYEFLHFLSQYNYWSTRIYAWKSLRDRFAPDYKEWLQKRNQQLSSENNNNDMPDVKYNETKVQTPEATTSDENSRRYGVNFEEMLPSLIEAVK